MCIRDRLQPIANIISWNLWQMDGLHLSVPGGKPQPETEPVSYTHLDVYKRQLENAASVAEMVLTTESLVADLPEPPAAPAAGRCV